MIRALIAVVFLGLVAAPAFACPYEDSAGTDPQSKTAATQPATDHATPPPASTDKSKAPS